MEVLSEIRALQGLVKESKIYGLFSGLTNPGTFKSNIRVSVPKRLIFVGHNTQDIFKGTKKKLEDPRYILFYQISAMHREQKICKLVPVISGSPEKNSFFKALTKKIGDPIGEPKRNRIFKGLMTHVR